MARQKKPHYKKVIFDRLDATWKQNWYIIRSSGQGGCISNGFKREDLAFKHCKLAVASGVLAGAQQHYPVKLTSGRQQKVDIMLWWPNGDQDALDAKPETTNSSYDPHLTVQGHVHVRDQLTAQNPGHRVTYSLLRVGEEEDKIWASAGIPTKNMNKYLSDLRGCPVDILKEEAVHDLVTMLERLKKCCLDIEQPFERGISALRMIGTPDHLIEEALIKIQ